MSVKHPVIAITGSSGAGTTSVTRTFQHIFRREKLNAAIVEGDAFHRYDRTAMKAAMADAAQSGNNHFSHFGPDANLFTELESLFREYSETGCGKRRHYIHDEADALRSRDSGKLDVHEEDVRHVRRERGERIFDRWPRPHA